MKGRAHHLIHWLLSEGTACLDMQDFLRCYTLVLRRHGLPVSRLFVGTILMHPQASGYIYHYEFEGDVAQQGELSYERFARLRRDKNSPMEKMLATGRLFRARLRLGEHLDMVDLASLADAGYTDLIGLPITCGGLTEAGLTVATTASDGFAEEDVEDLAAANPTFGVVARLLMERQVQGTLLKAYLGEDAGDRVHRGQVRCGDTQIIPAAVWISDLRGFTRLSINHDAAVVVDLLNEVFEVVVREIRSHHGQVLKFLGDGVLATFAQTDVKSACLSALMAAQAVQTHLASISKARQSKGLPVTQTGIGLHYGEVIYGNIGAPGRLDFTVIGPAVNLAARVESLCAPLGESILMTKDFADALATPMTSCGAHALKGIADPVTVYRPD